MDVAEQASTAIRGHVGHGRTAGLYWWVGLIGATRLPLQIPGVGAHTLRPTAPTFLATDGYDPGDYAPVKELDHDEADAALRPLVAHLVARALPAWRIDEALGARATLNFRAILLAQIDRALAEAAPTARRIVAQEEEHAAARHNVDVLFDAATARYRQQPDE